MTPCLLHVQVSFGGLGLKVTDEQLLEAARSMMADALAARGVPIHVARESVKGLGLTETASGVQMDAASASRCSAAQRSLWPLHTNIVIVGRLRSCSAVLCQFTVSFTCRNAGSKA